MAASRESSWMGAASTECSARIVPNTIAVQAALPTPQTRPQPVHCPADPHFGRVLAYPQRGSDIAH